jgi:hypothetical protein
MYVYKPELITQEKFPIIRTYQGKTKVEAAVQIAARESIEQEQNLEEIASETIEKVAPKDVSDMPVSRLFEKDGNPKSDTQNDTQTDTSTEDLMISNDGWVPLFR